MDFDKVFIRNYVLFFLTLVFCAGTLIYILIAGERDIGKTDLLVNHTHQVITKAEQLSAYLEGMLAAQRAYIISGNEDFLAGYNNQRKIVLASIMSLKSLTRDNEDQVIRLQELETSFQKFSILLEERAQKFVSTPRKLENVEVVDTIKNKISKINQDVLEAEYALLEARIDIIQNKKKRYFTTLFIGVVLTSAMLLLFNGFLLRAQSRRTHAETIMKETEERFRLAVQGSKDGIFDWNIGKKELFWSPQFKDMLGYQEHELIASTEEFERLIHDEDIENVSKTIDMYLKQELLDFSAVFRMRHKSGKWLWINARGKAAFDKNGVATRMVGAYTDITALKDYEQQLERARIQAEKANLAKSDFLAHMSHEIRTPLTAISGIAEIFEKNQADLSEKNQRLVKTLNSSTSALKELISDILDFSKIENGELDLDLQNFEIAQLFEQVISMMSLRASQKKISFICDYSALKNEVFYGDINRLRQILVNLVGNALKFTEQGGVTIKAIAEHAQNGRKNLKIEIIDTGIGIPAEHQKIIFERFKQGDASVSRKYGGTGLGLPISQNLVQLMGGTLTLKSEENIGSTFTILLPFTEKKSEEEKAPTEIKKIKKFKAQVDSGKRILLVEDYEGNIVVLSYILDEIDCLYDVARTGREALNLWEKNHYDLILMDIQMPEMDGFSATSAIRLAEHEQDLPRTPIIGMTAHALVGDKDKCIQSGMDSYLPKPIVENDLKQQIQKYISRKAA